ncbi:uncharacterized protein LOC121514478 [Cheilinus undulatus]|uniref:uncharacterized protein LOC121514478 n=1 Tax=Cheilinus undulatus TaxID=241271 RepID=UPI001BD2804A|nr:uncharacterized protein LOC121514478 [Cheilinus undulatus]
MHLTSFGTCVDKAVEELLVGLLDVKMFGSGTKKWFVKKQKRQQHQRLGGRRPCTRKKKRWAANILKQHRQKILNELDVNTVLPYLVYDKVFSLGEYKEILGHESRKKRTEIFLDRLSTKGPSAFCSFCSVLEEVCPHLLTCFLLDGDGAPRHGRKGGPPVPPNSPREPHLCPPPMYTDPIFNTRIHPSPTAGSGTAASSASTAQGKPSLRRIKGRIHRSKSLDSIDLLDSNELHERPCLSNSYDLGQLTFFHSRCPHLPLLSSPLFSS